MTARAPGENGGAAGAFARGAVVIALVLASACDKKPAATDDGDAATPGPIAIASSAPPPPRAGMVWVPSGDLKAGTAKGKTPRLADEEMPGVTVPMNGFFIDVLPFPNEQGAIPTTNINRDEATRLCGTKGKRLCTELEWERACKGPDNTTYAYGETYRAAACGTGVTAEVSAKRPSGERSACKSVFGVMDMHGGVWEWTQSDWGRSSANATDGALRGGSAVAGEVVDRCANGLARSPSTKASTIGFRCCAGDKNPAVVSLAVEGGASLEAVRIAPLKELFGDLPPRAFDPEKLVECNYVNALTWRPTPNEALSILVGCTNSTARKCGVFIGSEATGKAQRLAAQAFGPIVPEVLPTGDRKVLKLRAVDWRGSFSREVSYSYGRVDVGPETRP